MNNLKINSTPKLVWILTASMLVFGIFATPSIFLNAGIMAESLESSIESVRKVAYIEVNLIRISAVLLSAVLFIMGLFWKRILEAGPIKKVLDYTVPEWMDLSAEWKIHKIAAVTGFIFIFLMLLYIIYGDLIFSDSILLSLNVEDGLLENSTAAFFFIAGTVCIAAVLNYRRSKVRWIANLIFALGFFIIAGEEISWGQRIFGIETLEFLSESNVQNENNLHNLLGYAADHFAVIIIFLYGAVLPVLAKSYPFFRNLTLKFSIPVPSLGLAICFLITSLIHDWTLGRVIEPLPYLRIPEAREFLTGLLFLLVSIESLDMSIRYRKTVPMEE